ncbi:hypothetical protein HK097_006835 [Rhizophlyctis rosea]|uniref:Coth protein-domain-containing protein n=1 Tax=Rhizophlyctis rosea TaxID=64517 RepID=A0AAD5SCD5_9FUNG|nr:hypothetical protein HK097_006835 [Rhizophlyctis rosea]
MLGGKLYIILAAAAIGHVHSRDVNFRVISMSTSVSVSVGGKTHQLTATSPDLPYFTGKVTVPDGDVKYNYVAGDFTEPFERNLPASWSQTYNDLVNRSQTVVPLPPFPWPHDQDPQWKRQSNPLPLFDHSFIPVIYVSAPQAAIDLLNVNLKGVVPGSVTFFYGDEYQTFASANYSIHKDGKDYWAKRALKIALLGDDSINGRKYFKLRDLAEDPTYMREVLYSNMLQAAGVGTPNVIHVRVYVNRVPMGLFALTDYTKIGSLQNIWENFAVSHFHGGKFDGQIVNWFDCGTGADFVYKGENHTMYVGYENDNPITWNEQDLIPVFRELANIKGSEPAADAFVTNTFDVESIMRSMVFEYLTGSWDGYWLSSSNFAIYKDPQTNKWFFIPQDFDLTWGLLTDLQIPALRYEAYEKAQGTISNYSAPLITSLLQVPKYRTLFETRLKDTVQRLFNPVAFNRRSNALHARLLEEVEWDLASPRLHPGKPNAWVVDDFRVGLEQTIDRGTWGHNFGMNVWVEGRARAVCEQFGIKWDEVPRDPPLNEHVNGVAPPSGPASGTNRQQDAATSSASRAEDRPPTVFSDPLAVTKRAYF